MLTIFRSVPTGKNKNKQDPAVSACAGKVIYSSEDGMRLDRIVLNIYRRHIVDHRRCCKDKTEWVCPVSSVVTTHCLLSCLSSLQGSLYSSRDLVLVLVLVFPLVLSCLCCFRPLVINYLPAALSCWEFKGFSMIIDGEWMRKGFSF